MHARATNGWIPTVFKLSVPATHTRAHLSRLPHPRPSLAPCRASSLGVECLLIGHRTLALYGDIHNHVHPNRNIVSAHFDT